MNLKSSIGVIICWFGIFCVSLPLVISGNIPSHGQSKRNQQEQSENSNEGGPLDNNFIAGAMKNADHLIRSANGPLKLPGTPGKVLPMTMGAYKLIRHYVENRDS